MKLLNFTAKGETRARLGIWSIQGIIDVVEVAAKNQLTVPRTIHDAIEGNSGGLQAVVELADDFLSESEITYLPSVLQPDKIIGIGLNTERYVHEAGIVTPAGRPLFA